MSEVAIMYLRRSTDRQEDSLEQQQPLNEAYVRAKGYVVHARKAVWAETGSGTSFDDRPVFQALLREVEGGETEADVLVMYRPHRFGRAKEITEFHYYEFRFHKAGVRIEYASGEEYLPGLAGHLTRTLAYAQASEYSKNLSTDSTRGLIANARAGYSTGGEPVLGYDRMLVDRDGNEIGVMVPGTRKGDDRTLKVRYVPTRNEAVRDFVVEEVFGRPYRMQWGPAQTARHLNQLAREGRGFPATRAGRRIRRTDGRIVPYSGTWHAATVEAMWMAYTYIGWRTLVVEADNEFHGEHVVCRDAHEPLIDEETFWGLFERTRQRPWNTRKLGPHRRREPGSYPLSGLGRCAHCGMGLSGSRTGNKKKGNTQLYYRDSGETNGACSAPRWSIRTEVLHTWVRDRIAARLRSEPFQRALLQLLRDRLAPESASSAELALGKLREVERSIERLLDLAANSDVPSDALSRRLEALEIEKRRLTEASAGATVRPTIPTPELERQAAGITERAIAAIGSDNAVLAEVARHFVQGMTVDKIRRRIDVTFYDIPGFEAVLGSNLGTRIERMEAAGVEPASGTARPQPLRV